MNILEMTTFLRGGAGAFLTRLSCELKRKGHYVDVISSGKVEELVDWDELINELSQLEINHYTMNFFKRENEKFWIEADRLARLINENNYDVIHVHAGVPALAVHIAKELTGMQIPVIATFHSWGPNRPEWMNISDAWAFNRCNKIFFDSNEYMKFGKSKGIVAKSGVIYPGLMMDKDIAQSPNGEYREELVSKLNIPIDSIIITNLAEITERKGQIDLVKALGNICDVRKDVYLCLIGESRDKHYYEKLVATIRDLQIEDRVFLMGWVEDPYRIVSSSDIFVFPSYSEGLGLAIIEAISLGVPTLFSSIEGTKDIENVLGKYCLGTFEPGNHKQISKLLLNLLEKNRSEVDNQIVSSQKRVLDVFDFHKTVDRYEEEMFKLINK